MLIVWVLKKEAEKGVENMVAIVQTLIVCATVILCVGIVVAGRDNNKKK